MNEAKNVATMKAAELEEFIAQADREHREYMKSLRALMRIRYLEERAKENKGD
uniref:Uncharacterized protein n=1 Tax=viral metagenome TaxID=1070528 RepID=A0A6M3LS23_9ZZZZ